MKRRDRGATLAFVAGSIIFIVIVALAFFFLSQLLGGGRELQAATNSGTLNVAKQALLHPQVAVPSGDQTTADMKEILLGVLPADQVNLLNFNRMVGAAMLVAMNADADRNDDAVKNAETFIDLVEGKNGGGGNSASAGQALRDQLANGSGWAKKYFEDTAMGNSLRMLGDNSGVRWQSGDFNVGYYNANQPTNISLNNFKSGNNNNLPFTNIEALGESLSDDTLVRGSLPKDDAGDATAKSDGTNTLLLGYKGIKFGTVKRHLFAVPLDTQPHLVSLSDFGNGNVTAQPGGSTIVVPPNAFMNGALGRDQRKTKKDVHMLAAAMAGTNQRPFEIGLPYGYIVLDNRLSSTFDGVIPNSDTVFSQELGSPGINVDSKSGYFERGDTSEIKDWHDTPRDVNAQGQPFDAERDGPAWDKIFTKSGDAPASKTDVASNIEYQGSSVTCNHSNSDVTSPGANSNCTHGTAPAPDGGICPFDKAFHPDRKNATPFPGDKNALTATEQTGCKVIDLWNKATLGQPYSWNAGKSAYTGIGLYPANHNPIKGESVPWSSPSNPVDFKQDDTGSSYSDKDVPCKVTHAGNFVQYVNQTVDYTPVNGKPNSPQAEGLSRIIKQRMHEILPTDDAAIDAAFTETALKPIPLGSVLFIYLDPTTNFKKFISDPNGPPWLSKGTLKNHRFRNPNDPANDGVDGKDVVVKTQTYGVAMTVADAKHQFGIHDTPFIHVNGEMVTISADAQGDPNGNGAIKATDQVFVNANTGAFGNLLNVTFQESTEAQGGVDFTDRD
jgi:hypothetical protein